jgi:type III pantothenate kinase
MDINVLVVNVGNSRLALGAFVGGQLQNVQRVGQERRSDWPAVIAQAWETLAAHPGAGVAGASVNPPLVEHLEHAVMQTTFQPVQWVGKELDIPIKDLTENPQQTGIDRILNVAAAYEQMQKACMVVDAGTAITVSCCNDEGAFVGGAIAPGASMQLSAMHEHTAKLPQVAFDVPAGALGRSTESAMLHGVYHGVRGMVKELAESFATELGNWPEIIATGGDAPMLFRDWELIHAIAPDLTLYGIALAYAEHHIKHGT